MQRRSILRRFLYRFVEGLLITIVGFTLFDLLWYAYDAVGAFLNGSDLGVVDFKLTINLSRLLALPTVYSFVLIILDSLKVQTKGPLFDWIEERYLRKQK